MKNSKQEKLDKIWLHNAVNIAALSHCLSHQVACVFVKDGRSLISGINGTAAGYENCDEHFCHHMPDDRAIHIAWSEKYERHAEMSAIVYAAKHGIKLEGSTLYCTLQPCWNCIKNFADLNLERVVFIDKYDRGGTIEEISNFLKPYGTIVEQITL